MRDPSGPLATRECPAIDSTARKDVHFVHLRAPGRAMLVGPCLKCGKEHEYVDGVLVRIPRAKVPLPT